MIRASELAKAAAKGKEEKEKAAAAKKKKEKEKAAAKEEKGDAAGDEEEEWRGKPTVVVGNKADLPEGLDGYEELESELGGTYPVIMASAEEGVGLDELAVEVFLALGVIRVYTKSPREKLEEFVRENPFVLPIGSTVSLAAEQVHKDLGRRLKYAVLWGQSGKFEAQRVGPRHELADEDIVELHS